MKGTSPAVPCTWAAASPHVRGGPGDLITRAQERGAAMLPAARRAAARLVLSRVAEAYGRMLLQDGCARVPRAALSEPAQWAPICGACHAPAGACHVNQRCPRQSRLLQGRSQFWLHRVVQAWEAS
jgi:cytochrome c553